MEIIGDGLTIVLLLLIGPTSRGISGVVTSKGKVEATDRARNLPDKKEEINKQEERERKEAWMNGW